MQVWCDWQVTLCDPHLSALEVRFSRRCAIQIDVYLYLYTVVAPSGERLRGEGRYGVFAVWKLCDPYLSTSGVRFSWWGAVLIFVLSAVCNGLKPSFHYPSWRPVNSGSGNRALMLCVVVISHIIWSCVLVCRPHLVWWSRISLWRWKRRPTVCLRSTQYSHDAGQVSSNADV